MAKKSASATASSEATKTPETKKNELPSLPCALDFFWDYTILSWGYCKEHLAKFAARHPFYTVEFIDGKLAYINEIRQLPNNSARSSKNTKALLTAEAERQAVAKEAKVLASAIEFFFREQPSLVPVELKEAGLTDFQAAKKTDLPAVSTFIIAANTYLASNGEQFVSAGALTANFSKDFETIGTAFNAAKEALTAKRQSGKDGTKAVADGIIAIQKDLKLMQDTGKDIYELEPDNLKLFTQEYLVAQVRNGHPAKVSGRTNWFDAADPKGGKPIAGLLVEVLGEEGKSAITDKLGRYKIQLSGGSFTLRFSGEAVSPIEKMVVLEPGVNRRVNVILEPAPVVPAEERIVQAPSATTSLSNAVSELLDKSKATNGVQEGAVI